MELPTMTGRKLIRLTNTAYHEAGHAVATWRLGLRVATASIEKTEQYLGMVSRTATRLERQVEDSFSPRVVDRLERLIMIAWAGALAVRRLNPRSKWRNGADSDFEWAGDLFNRICGFDAKAQRLYSGLLWRRTELLIEGNWPLVEHVAGLLLERTNLSGQEVNAACLEALGVDSTPFTKKNTKET
jgi:hypothetical protein